MEARKLTSTEQGNQVPVRVRAEPVRVRASDADRSRAELASENGYLRERVKDLELQLNDIITSRSWKITEPLRQFTKIRKKIFPLWRRGAVSCRFQPATGMTAVEVRPGVFDVSIVGPNARLNVECASIPSGTVLIEVTLDKPFVSFLYYKVGEQFTDDCRVSIPLIHADEQKPSVALIALPPGVKALQIMPLHGDGTYRLSNFSLRPLGSAQMMWHLFSQKVLPAFRNRAELRVKLKKAWAIYREGGFAALQTRLFASQRTNNYHDWVEKYDSFTQADSARIARMVAALPYAPTFSVLMPTYKTPLRWLTAAIESVRNQVYTKWELCIVDDASHDAELRRTLEEYAAKDSRIKVSFRDENGHISKASNDALRMATGEYVVLLDHDDEITPDALAVVAHAVAHNRNADFLYSDEDKLTSYGMRFNPHFKSDWNPFLILSQNYICHLAVYRRAIVQEIGGFREDGVDGAQDWDLALRVAEKIPGDHIVHLPFVLYHWRVIQGSTAHTTAAKPYVLEAQRKVVQDHFARRGISADVSILPTISHVRPHFQVPRNSEGKKPLVSILIPTRNQLHHLRRCIESIVEKSTYREFEIIVVDNGSDCEDTLRYFDELCSRPYAQVIRDDSPFNYSRLNNEAAKVARGEYLALLNNDLEVITPEWLDELIGVAALPGVGAVGARLLYPHDLLQHGGVILGIGGVAGHTMKGSLRHDPGYWNRSILMQNLSAVTAACMVVPARVFREVGGLDDQELSVAFNDVDLCLKIRSRGLSVVYQPYAELYHYESASRGYDTTPEKYRRFEREIEVMKTRWGAVIANDPYYNPNLTIVSEDFQFAFPPRVTRPWRE